MVKNVIESGKDEYNAISIRTDSNNLQVLSDEISKKQKVRETILVCYMLYDIPRPLPVLQCFSFAFSSFRFCGTVSRPRTMYCLYQSSGCRRDRS